MMTTPMLHADEVGEWSEVSEDRVASRVREIERAYDTLLRTLRPAWRPWYVFNELLAYPDVTVQDVQCFLRSVQRSDTTDGEVLRSLCASHYTMDLLRARARAQVIRHLEGLRLVPPTDGRAPPVTIERVM